jgi:hypothetical protein
MQIRVFIPFNGDHRILAKHEVSVSGLFLLDITKSISKLNEILHSNNLDIHPPPISSSLRALIVPFDKRTKVNKVSGKRVCVCECVFVICTSTR